MFTHAKTVLIIAFLKTVSNDQATLPFAELESVWKAADNDRLKATIKKKSNEHVLIQNNDVAIIP